MPKKEVAAKRHRQDPERRHLDPQARWAKVKNCESGRRYCLVYKPQVEEYEDRGWVVERARAGGPSLLGKGNTPESEVIEARGHVLMSISAADHEELRLYGDDGHTGYARWDRMQQQILDPRGTDLLRGLRAGHYLQFVNNTTPATAIGDGG